MSFPLISLGNNGQDGRTASSENQFFVLKPASSSIFNHLLEFDKEFGGNPRIRLHIDYNDKENVIIYEGFTTDVLSLVKNYPPLPLEVRKTILREVGLGLKEMHASNWVHLGMATFIGPHLLSLITHY